MHETFSFMRFFLDAKTPSRSGTRTAANTKESQRKYAVLFGHMRIFRTKCAVQKRADTNTLARVRRICMRNCVRYHFSLSFSIQSYWAPLDMWVPSTLVLPVQSVVETRMRKVKVKHSEVIGLLDDVTHSATASAGRGRALQRCRLNCSSHPEQSIPRMPAGSAFKVGIHSESGAVQALYGSAVNIVASFPNFPMIEILDLVCRTISIWDNVYLCFGYFDDVVVPPNTKAIVVDTGVPLERDWVRQVRLPGAICVKTLMPDIKACDLFFSLAWHPKRKGPIYCSPKKRFYRYMTFSLLLSVKHALVQYSVLPSVTEEKITKYFCAHFFDAVEIAKTAVG